MNKWIISDLHLGHKSILEFEPNRLGEKVDSVEEHDDILEVRYRATVQPKDTCYFLGDVAFSAKKLESIKNWPGRKVLIRGNHDDKSEELYRHIFTKIYGVLKIDRVWFSHAPIHTQELRGCPSVHGHVHSNIILDGYHRPDKRYRAVCVEQNQGWPESFDRVIEEVKSNG